MDETNTAVNTNQSAATDETTASVVLTANEDAEARIAALEAEKAKLTEEGANWKVAALKYKSKAKDDGSNDDEDMEDKMRRIAAEALATSRLAEIAQEQQAIINTALKENKELKLAQLNKTGTPLAAIGTHSESTPVRDTAVTPDQMAAFKARGWTDKDIERYKKNLQKYSGR
jgi:hypothetical protein